jgi:hypothetical protein
VAVAGDGDHDCSELEFAGGGYAKSTDGYSVCGLDWDWLGGHVALGIGLFGESAALNRLACLALIVMGIIGLKLLGK